MVLLEPRPSAVCGCFAELGLDAMRTLTATSASHFLELAAKEATRSSHCPSNPGRHPHTISELEPECRLTAGGG